MTAYNAAPSHQLGTRVALAFAVVAAALILWMTVGKVSPATASPEEPFCSNVTLQPYGQGGDRCWGWSTHLGLINLFTNERAGCMDVADGSNNLLQSWSCISSHNSGQIIVGNETELRKGVIRNNNLSATGVFSGKYICYGNC